MAKKPTKRARRREIINDPALPLLAGIEAVKPAARKPLPAARQRAWNRERERWKESQRVAAAARRAERQARLERRPKQFTDGFTLPDDVRRFVLHLFDAGMYEVPSFDQPGDRMTHVLELLRRLEAAYLQGVTQGYIEGRIAGLEPRQKASRKALEAKRKKPREYAGTVMTTQERDERIAAEYATLCTMMPVGQARERLAVRYECDPRTIYNVARKAGVVPKRPRR